MKTMTCTQLGGACDKTFQADTFEEMATLAKQHGGEMMNDTAHKGAMARMMKLMQNPVEMQEWMEQKKQEFDSLPEDN